MGTHLALQRQQEGLTPQQIKQLRLSLGWTQARVALVIGVHRLTISRWECGRQRPSYALGLRLELLARSGSERQQVSGVAPSAATTSKASRDLSCLRRELQARLEGRQVVASISGGKDSAAMSLHLHELGIDHQRVFMDTGWESPITYEYLRGELPKIIGPITWIRGERQMEDLIRHKGMFPGRRIRYCMQELKVFPMIRYLKGLVEAGQEPINAVGIRAAESIARSQLSEWDWQEGFDCAVWRPLLRWTEQEVIDIHRRHGLKPNPLYLLGAARVGCWPCIYARKSEIRLIAETDPERIVRLRVLEDEVEVAARKRAERDGRELTNAPAWFQNPVSRPGPDGKRDGSCWPIEQVVAWSRTAFRGPTQDKDEFLLSSQMDGCMRWGLCDVGTGAEVGDAAEAQPGSRRLALGI